ncbi:integrase catalytic domain-containing protein [Trichonephila clavipes]|nr:integrase catalytic domain-containing protein [Trichonephila clavipes]
MSSRHHIDDFMRGRIIGKIEEGRRITDVAREFDIAHSVVSRLWKSFKTTLMCSRRHGGGRVRSTTPTIGQIYRPISKKKQAHHSSAGGKSVSCCLRKADLPKNCCQTNVWTVSTWRQERNSSNVFVTETKTNCVLCKGNNFHPLSKCYQFKKLSVEDRVEVVKRNNLCFRCFLPHRLKECCSEKNCFCLRPHNSLIHFSSDKTRNPTPTSNLNLDAPTFVPGQIEGSVEANLQSQFVATGFEKGRLKNVFLSTVRPLVKNKYSQWVEVRCLLDVGSQSCLCTRACAEKLQLKMEKINAVVSCVNDASMVVKNCVKTSVANKAKTFESELMLLVVNKITDLIPNKVIDVDVNVSEFVPLADDIFNIPDRIDMLLGAEIFCELLKPGKFYCDNSHLVLQNTVFGYVVSVDHTSYRESRSLRINC